MNARAAQASKLDYKLVARVDVRTLNPNNGATGNSKLAGIIRSRERAKQRATTLNVMRAVGGSFGRFITNQSVVVTMTRVAPSTGLDPHDGLRAALKGPVDGVADWLGLKSDRDPRVEWRYAQRRGRRAEYAVEIIVETAT